MSTLREIANHLGLSVSTVSRALSGTGRVGEETVRRVQEYTREIDYHPNQLAKGLKLQSSRTIGVVVPDISNEFYALLYKEVDRILAPQGYTPVLFDIGDDPAREDEFLAHLRSSTVDGMVVATAGTQAYAALPGSLRDRIVFVDNYPSKLTECTYVRVDNVRSSYMLTQHLIDRGHTRIATVMGPEAESSANERERGLRAAMADNGLPLHEEWMVRARFQYADGYAKAAALLAGPERPTAIIAQNNVLAYATIRVAHAASLQVPGDLAVACFDHIDTYGFMRPVITTVVQPLRLIAEAACRHLQANLAGERATVDEPIQAEFRLGETS